jgi:hypothetical protein
MSIMSNHVIHLKSCHSCQIMSFMSNPVIHVKSCHSWLFQKFSKVGRGGTGVKYVFLSLRRQLRQKWIIQISVRRQTMIGFGAEWKYSEILLAPTGINLKGKTRTDFWPQPESLRKERLWMESFRKESRLKVSSLNKQPYDRSLLPSISRKATGMSYDSIRLAAHEEVSAVRGSWLGNLGTQADLRIDWWAGLSS